ncbi:MAG: hypothetical protein ACRDRQ_21555, partial [Pseudonocardiaceae bacterium]
PYRSVRSHLTFDDHWWNLAWIWPALGRLPPTGDRRVRMAGRGLGAAGRRRQTPALATGATTYREHGWHPTQPDD